MNNLDKPINYVGMEKLTFAFVKHARNAMFPNYFEKDRNAFNKSFKCLYNALKYTYDDKKSKEIVEKVKAKMPEILKILRTDIQAAYDGDPASQSHDEIILSYPFFKADVYFRLAHELYLENVKILPRMIMEYVHKNTGMDIHPGATIGEYFFIDHGTGVVIGETTVIGNHVRMYQNVTLGTKNFDMTEEGFVQKGGKRHPNIGNHVIIYASATVLGGETFVGDDCVIGSNAFVTNSIEKGTVYTKTR